ncbi:MAG TPA: MEDS domain-containing protein [Gemmatimonadales bacterium]|jgi:hypothetical protein|nr:MEDS domain-containing protein [Gemmatimonadales bacterium]
MTSPAELLDNPAPEEHLLQLYGSDDPSLVRNVTRYLREGLRRGDGLTVIATAPHRASFARILCEEPLYSGAVLTGRLVFLDAEMTLGRFMIGGQPDETLFSAVIGDALDGVRSRAAHSMIRAYGEMVAVLWSRGEYDAAIRLEALWNRLLTSSDVSLFCAYPIDVLGPEFHHGPVESVLHAHSRIVGDDNLEPELNRF